MFSTREQLYFIPPIPPSTSACSISGNQRRIHGDFYRWGIPEIVGSKWKIPVPKMDDNGWWLGVPPFQEASTWQTSHINEEKQISGCVVRSGTPERIMPGVGCTHTIRNIELQNHHAFPWSKYGVFPPLLRNSVHDAGITIPIHPGKWSNYEQVPFIYIYRWLWTIVIFNSYVKLPEGSRGYIIFWPWQVGFRLCNYERVTYLNCSTIATHHVLPRISPHRLLPSWKFYGQFSLCLGWTHIISS